MEQGRPDEAVAVMCQVFGTTPDDEYVQAEKAGILEALAIESESPFKWSKLFQKDAVQTGWRIVLAVLVLAMNQVRYPALIFRSTWLTVSVGWHQRGRFLHRNSFGSQCRSLKEHVSRRWRLRKPRICRGLSSPSPWTRSFRTQEANEYVFRKPKICEKLTFQVFGAAGSAISMMMIAILLSFRGTDKQTATSAAAIAFFVTVSC